MSKTIQKNMDPFEIENRFSNEKGFFFDQEDRYIHENLKPFLEKLPEKERDLIEMYYTDQKKQKEIADFFNVTQGAISHRLSKAKKRLIFLRNMPKINGDIKEILQPYFDRFEIDIIRFMVQTTCQSKTADLMNDKYKLQGQKKMTQVKVRHKLYCCLDRLKRLKRKHMELVVCFELVEYVKEHLYMMHEVVLPQFDRGYKAHYIRIT